LLIVTGVVPKGKKDPDAGFDVIELHVPEVVALKLTIAPGTVAGSPLLSTPGPVVSAVTVIFPGQVSAQLGGVGLVAVMVVGEVLLVLRGSSVALETLTLLASVRTVPVGMLSLM
jgi:hypothetical protein